MVSSKLIAELTWLSNSSASRILYTVEDPCVKRRRSPRGICWSGFMTRWNQSLSYMHSDRLLKPRYRRLDLFVRTELHRKVFKDHC